jgi:glycosyltransferase involved in cell wall biosynthesis
MRILHVIHYYHEGFGYQENWLAAHQLKLGHEVCVVTSDYYFPFPNYEATMAPTLGSRYVGTGRFTDGDIPVIRKPARAASVGPPGLIWFPIQQELESFRPDIIHLHGATSPLFFTLLRHRKRLNYEVFVDSHQDVKVEGKSDSAVYRAYYGLWRFLLHQRGLKHQVARFLPITQAAQTWMTDKLKLADDVMTISPLGVDLETMKLDDAERIDFRRAHRLGNRLVIVNAGKQYPEKRIEWVIEVAAAAKAKGAEIALVLVGSADEHYEQQIAEALTQLNAPTIRLPFLSREKLRRVYAGCDVGIWPGIPSNTIQEAMSCGCAMILPDDDIVGHLVDENGIKTATNVDVAAKYLVSLSQNEDQLTKAQSASIEIARRYSWSNITQDLMRIYTRYSTQGVSRKKS